MCKCWKTRLLPSNHNLNCGNTHLLPFSVRELFRINGYALRLDLAFKKAFHRDFSHVNGSANELSPGFYNDFLRGLRRELHDDCSHVVHERLSTDKDGIVH